MSVDRSKIMQLVLVALFGLVTLCLYTPSELFLTNINEFDIDYHQTLGIMLLISLTWFAIVFGIGIVIINYHTIFFLYLDLIFGIILASYIQGNFLNGDIYQLDGKEIIFNNEFSSISSFIAWTVCIILPHIVRKINNIFAQRIIIVGCSLLSVMQMSALIFMLLCSGKRTISKEILVTKTDEFQLSKKNNVIVFVVDTLDARWAEEYVLNNDEIIEKLNGFTYFNNVVGGGAPTMIGMPTLLTGEIFNPYDETLDEYYKRAWEKSPLLFDLHENDYKINIYTEADLLKHAQMDYINNIKQGSYTISKYSKFTKLFYEMVAYYLAPYQLKSTFRFYSGDFSDCISAKEDKYELYSSNDDVIVYQDFQKNGLSINERKNVFVLYHLFGAHAPYRMNENAEADENSSLKQQIHGTFKIICEYLDVMKEKGIYDDSTIIITADHGAVSLEQNPAVFIKRANDKGMISVNSKPITFKNVRATFVSSFIKDYYDIYGYDAFDFVQSDLEEYRLLTCTSNLRSNVFSDTMWDLEQYMQFLIGDPARDDSQIIEVNPNPFKYNLGETIYFHGSDKTYGINMSGFSHIEDAACWTLGNNAEIEIELAYKESDDLLLKMDFTTYFQQEFEVFVNGHSVGRFNGDGKFEQNYLIPSEYLVDDKILLEFYLPDAVSPYELGLSGDTRQVAISLHTIVIEKSIKNLH